MLETKLALIVGVARHEDHNIPKLKYAEEDAISIHEYMTSPEGGRIPTRNARLLTNERASRKEILEGLDYLVRRSRERDSVVIYFAGYGAARSAGSESEEGESETSPDKTESGKDNGDSRLYLVPYDGQSSDIENTCISIEEIEERLAVLSARELVIILDAGSGGGLESRALSETDSTAPIFQNILEQSGRYALLSGQPGEGAMEIEDHRHGVFTFYLLEGLKGPADQNKDGDITLKELHDYLNSKVAEETEMEGSGQHPCMGGASAENTVFGTTP
jgi:uncharacterized caspase-like protein